MSVYAAEHDVGVRDRSERVPVVQQLVDPSHRGAETNGVEVVAERVDLETVDVGGRHAVPAGRRGVGDNVVIDDDEFAQAQARDLHGDRRPRCRRRQ